MKSCFIPAKKKKFKLNVNIIIFFIVFNYIGIQKVHILNFPVVTINNFDIFHI